jgi:hypothetical protein
MTNVGPDAAEPAGRRPAPPPVSPHVDLLIFEPDSGSDD